MIVINHGSRLGLDARLIKNRQNYYYQYKSTLITFEIFKRYKNYITSDTRKNSNIKSILSQGIVLYNNIAIINVFDQNFSTIGSTISYFFSTY